MLHFFNKFSERISRSNELWREIETAPSTCVKVRCGQEWHKNHERVAGYDAMCVIYCSFCDTVNISDFTGRNTRWLTYDWLERMWKEAVVTKLVVLTQKFSRRTEELVCLVLGQGFEIGTSRVLGRSAASRPWIFGLCLVVLQAGNNTSKKSHAKGHGYWLISRGPQSCYWLPWELKIWSQQIVSASVFLLLFFIFECYHKRASYWFVILPLLHIHSHWCIICAIGWPYWFAAGMLWDCQQNNDYTYKNKCTSKKITWLLKSYC